VKNIDKMGPNKGITSLVFAILIYTTFIVKDYTQKYFEQIYKFAK
ncbi:31739_t:CDS:1, partial [Racocetra persica]